MGARKDRTLSKNNVDMDPRGMPLGTRGWIYLRHSPGGPHKGGLMYQVSGISVYN
jgi:hypothetical protein